MSRSAHSMAMGHYHYAIITSGQESVACRSAGQQNHFISASRQAFSSVHVYIVPRRKFWSQLDQLITWAAPA